MKKAFLTVLFLGIITQLIFVGCEDGCGKNSGTYYPYYRIDEISAEIRSDIKPINSVDDTISFEDASIIISTNLSYLAQEKSNWNFVAKQAFACSPRYSGDQGAKEKLDSISVKANMPIENFEAGDELRSIFYFSGFFDEKISHDEYLQWIDNYKYPHSSILHFKHYEDTIKPIIFTISYHFSNEVVLQAQTNQVFITSHTN